MGKNLNKYIDRSNLIAYANVAPSIRADLYAQRVAPTLSYLAQIANITQKLMKAKNAHYRGLPISNTMPFPKRLSSTNRRLECETSTQSK